MPKRYITLRDKPAAVPKRYITLRGKPAPRADRRVARRVPKNRDSDLAPTFGTSPALALIALLDFAIAASDTLPGTVAVLSVLLLAPGSLLLRSLRITVTGATWWVYSSALSISLLMASGLTANLLLPLAGVQEPLRSLPLLVTVNVLMMVLGGAAASSQGRLRIPDLQPSAPYLLLSLPVLSAAGAQLLNNGVGRAVAVSGMCAVVAVLFALALRTEHFSDETIAAALGLCGVAMLLSFSLRGAELFGFDVHQEFGNFQATRAAGRWEPVDGDAYQAMLSITLLPTLLSALSGLAPLWVFKLLYPLLAGLFPVAVYVLARRWLPPRFAYLAGALVVVQPQFSAQLPALSRQVVGLLLFAALLAVAFDTGVALRRRQALILLLSFGVVVGHYSTADLAALVILAAALLGRALGAVSRTPGRPAIGILMAVALAAFSLLWKGPVTNTSNNAETFATAVAEQGPQFLPNRAHGDIVSTFLRGNVTAKVPVAVLEERAAEMVLPNRDWLVPYSPAVQEDFGVRDAVAPTSVSPLGPLAPPANAVTTGLRQVLNLMQVAGAGILVLRFRRNAAKREFALMALALVAVNVMGRVSGTVALAYNPERLVIQSLVVLGVGVALATMVIAARPAGRRTVALLMPVTVAALALQGSGLQPLLLGGGQRANLASSGEEAERFVTTQADVAGATWLGRTAPKGHLIYADTYGRLVIYSASDVRQGLFADLTARTIDQRAYVLATSTNIERGRARVSHGGIYSTFTFPEDFMESYKSRIYDNGSARVYG